MQVGIGQGRGTVADEDPCAVGEQLVDGSDHFALGGFVHRRGGLVEHQDRRLLEQRASDGDTLFLPTGKLLTALTEQPIQTQRQALHQAVQAGQAHHLLQLRAGGQRGAVGQVVGQGATEQHDILADHGNTPAQGLQVKFAQVDAVEQNASLLGS